MTNPITPEALESAGYKCFKTPPHERYARGFQKRICDDKGTLYFITFEEWVHQDRISFSADVTCDTDTGGYGWLKMREDTIEKTERRARLLWEAAGSIYYERNTP